MRIRERNQDSILPLLLAIALGALGLLAQDLVNEQHDEVEVSAVQCDSPGRALQC
ncbi:MAG: hypothetical protein ACJAYU_001475 [Bradymonadia bacterium]|jgi:hypothetical protein